MNAKFTPPEKPEGTVTITMTESEARWLLGVCRPLTAWEVLVYDALKRAGL